MAKKIIIFLMALIFVSQSHSAENISLDREIDILSEATLQEWAIPGLALSVIHKGKEIKVAGYGVKQRGTFDKVNSETVFQICSLTKAFTALVVSMLVEQGKLEWEQPIVTYLPSFKLKVPYAQENITLRDLLSQRTGLPGISKQSWRLWWHTGRSTQDLMHRLSFVEAAYPFRSHFSYNNMSYVVASQAIAKVSGSSWEKLCKEKIFQPLGMKRTSLSHAFLLEDKNVASAHLLPSLKKEPIPWQNWDNMSATGGINSSAQDMAEWLKYCLLNRAVFITTRSPQGLFEVEGFLDEISMPAWAIYTHNQSIVNYGFGWMMYTLNNREVFFHTGICDGMQSILAIVPEESLGISILTNEASHLGAACLLNGLLDRFLQLPKTDWHRKAHGIIENMDKTALQQRKHLEISREKNTIPTLHLGDYAGEYVHPAYGSIQLSIRGDEMLISLFSHEEGRLKHWQKDEFEITDVPSALQPLWLLEFQLSPDHKQVISCKIPELGVFEKQ
ncbi:MAG: serine hydrolase [Chlamydiota bacterium]